jgi:hypothetical protein
MALAGPGGSRRLLEGLREFREHLGGQLTVMLLEGLGRGVEVHEMDEDVLGQSLSLLAQSTRAGKEDHACRIAPALAP